MLRRLRILVGRQGLLLSKTMGVHTVSTQVLDTQFDVQRVGHVQWCVRLSTAVLRDKSRPLRYAIHGSVPCGSSAWAAAE